MRFKIAQITTYKIQRRIKLVTFDSGDSFLHFDYGSAENLKRYGTTYPPEYNLTKVTVPVYLVYGDNDPFAPIEVCCNY
jgi:lysosomal acid lipase/cholesteryl ester hydrolase